MESSRWDLLNDVAEHMSIKKDNQTTHYPRFSCRNVLYDRFPTSEVISYLIIFKYQHF